MADVFRWACREGDETRRGGFAMRLRNITQKEGHSTFLTIC